MSPCHPDDVDLVEQIAAVAARLTPEHDAVFVASAFLGVVIALGEQLGGEERVIFLDTLRLVASNAENVPALRHWATLAGNA